jgi:hypothetical protein
VETFAELGTVLSTHRVNNRRRLVSGLWALVVGVVASVLGAFDFAITDPSDGVGPNKTVGVVIGVGLCGLAIAAVQLSRAWRGGSDEYFEVREHGLIHADARQIRGWQWEAVTNVNIAVRARENNLSRALGTGLRCVISFEDGSRARFDGLTANTGGLTGALRERCDAGLFTDGLNGARRLGAWWLVFAAVFLAGGVWMVLTIVSSTPDQDAADPGTVSDTGYLFLALGMLVCLVGLITSVSFYLTARKR